MRAFIPTFVLCILGCGSGADTTAPNAPNTPEAPATPATSTNSGKYGERVANRFLVRGQFASPEEKAAVFANLEKANQFFDHWASLGLRVAPTISLYVAPPPGVVGHDALVAFLGPDADAKIENLKTALAKARSAKELRLLLSDFECENPVISVFATSSVAESQIDAVDVDALREGVVAQLNSYFDSPSLSADSEYKPNVRRIECESVYLGREAPTTPTDLSVLLHEAGHLMLSQTVAAKASLVVTGAPASPLHEAFADVIAASYLARPCIGASFGELPDSEEGCLRNLEFPSPGVFSDLLLDQAFLKTVDNRLINPADPHYQSRPISHLLWNISRAATPERFERAIIPAIDSVSTILSAAAEGRTEQERDNFLKLARDYALAYDQSRAFVKTLCDNLKDDAACADIDNVFGPRAESALAGLRDNAPATIGEAGKEIVVGERKGRVSFVSPDAHVNDWRMKVSFEAPHEEELLTLDFAPVNFTSKPGYFGLIARRNGTAVYAWGSDAELHPLPQR